MKNFEDEDLPREIFVTTRQGIKINRNAIANNTSADVKLVKDEILRFSEGSVKVLYKFNYDNDNGNKIIFTIKGTKLYVPVVTLTEKEKQKSS